jgi:hypothetical protein
MIRLAVFKYEWLGDEFALKELTTGNELGCFCFFGLILQLFLLQCFFSLL